MKYIWRYSRKHFQLIQSFSKDSQETELSSLFEQKKMNKK